MTKEEQKEKLIQEAKEFAAAYFEDRNNCVGREWVDNVTDSWIYDAEDFWMAEYKKKHKGKEPSRDEVHAHFVECRRLFDKQYAELFAERDTELILKGIVQDRLSACKKALEALIKLEQNSDSVKVRNAKSFIESICNEDKRLAESYKRFVNA